MKALWQDRAWVVIENHAEFVELEPVEGEGRVMVSFADPTLMIDPTDGDLDEAEQARKNEENE